MLIEMDKNGVEMSGFIHSWVSLGAGNFPGCLIKLELQDSNEPRNVQRWKYLNDRTGGTEVQSKYRLDMETRCSCSFSSLSHYSVCNYPA